ncbi:hypothetical protein H4Q32_024054 [Labeo rohita]|uniref:Uncharacterized protein n=1 Tax=Labeo rohita TaxID=84645 RepID=A0ABQ8LA11_LABRO|nr:hypothetical protein H4Q32_024054 [Labeo rohita]
MPLSIRSSS